MMDEFDEDKNGTIDCNELLELIDKFMGEHYTGTYVRERNMSVT